MKAYIVTFGIHCMSLVTVNKQASEREAWKIENYRLALITVFENIFRYCRIK